MVNLNLDAGHPLLGFGNLDRKTACLWENGLQDYADNSVDAITISHSLMYVEDQHWPFVFSELYRVLKRDGVVRITEDETDNPDSKWYRGHYEAVTLTSPAINRRYLEMVGFTVYDAGPEESKFADTSLCQSWHADSTVFYLEGVKEALRRENISACLVSRSPIDPRILDSLHGFKEIIVADGQRGPAARYEAVAKADSYIIYTQDDDCLVDVDALLKLWNGSFIANMMSDRLEPCFNNNTLTGWGTLYRKDLVQPALDRYTNRYGQDRLYWREADRIVSGLNPHPLVCVKVENLPIAYASTRLWRQSDHWTRREKMRRRLEKFSRKREFRRLWRLWARFKKMSRFK